jgi:DNA invertase Pin-like site-specific DNA recombinase
LSEHRNSPSSSLEERKAKIRERYKGINSDEIHVIPAIEQASFYEDVTEKRVAAYVRVSTDSAEQTSSYELQKNYYEETVPRHPGWKLVRIYADEGISGTSLKHRDDFLRMIKDCETGQIDLIVTKSVSRFSRNILDCIGEVRKLAALPHPVGVFFETENIYTLNPDSEMGLSFVSTLAQEESHSKSRIMNQSIEMRGLRGIFLKPELLGYDLDENKELVINPDEAKTVRIIFFMYMLDYSCATIAETLMRLGRLTKPGNTKWTAGSVLNILRNERYCGDILFRKTYTPNYLDHKSKKNRHQRRQFFRKDDHEAIISRDDFIFVQRKIENAKYRNKGLLPYIHVVEAGALRGFTIINPRWGAFTKKDYLEAVDSICADTTQPGFQDISVNEGDFDLRDFQVARGQFFPQSKSLTVTFSYNDISFTKRCVRKLNNAPVVELLIDPINKIFAVRPTAKDNRNGITWATVNDDNSVHQKKISGTAFLPTIYDMLGWKPENRYRLLGVRRQRENEVILLFDMQETEVLFPSNKHATPEQLARQRQLFADGTIPFSPDQRSKLVAFPQNWAESFGQNVYLHQQTPEVAPIDRDGQWDVSRPGTKYETGNEPNITTEEDLQAGLHHIISTLEVDENE